MLLHWRKKSLQDDEVQRACLVRNNIEDLRSQDETVFNDGDILRMWVLTIRAHRSEYLKNMDLIFRGPKYFIIKSLSHILL